jgi:hypothetical protein
MIDLIIYNNYILKDKTIFDTIYRHISDITIHS